MKRLSKWLFAVVVSTGIALPSTTFATNGMFLIGYGTKARGVGGVAIAMPQDAISGAANPATISFVGSRVDAGMDVFLPVAEVELDGLKQDSRAKLFGMPAMGGTYKFNRKVSMGFSAIPAGGGGSRYNINVYNNTQPGSPVDATLGINLMIMQMSPTVAYRVNKRNSIGASLIFSVQTFRAFGLQYFETFTQSFGDGDPVTQLTNNGNDWAYGAGVRIGWMGNYMKKKFSVGAVYTSRVYMTEFDKYSDLFAEQGDLDTPSNVGVGISYKFTPKLTVGMDITHTFYEDVAAIGNASATAGPGSIFPDADESHRMGADDGLGFGWENQTVYKVGAIYDYNKQWTLRTGWNYGKSPIDETNGEVLMSMLAPAVTQNHLSLGATWNPSKRLDVSFSYVHAFKFQQNGPTFIGNTGRLSMFQNSFGVSLGYDL